MTFIHIALLNKRLNMTYRGCTITRTTTTTNVVEWFCGKARQSIRKVYAIEGAIDKPAGRRPFITSIRAAKEYIRDKKEQSNET